MARLQSISLRMLQWTAGNNGNTASTDADDNTALVSVRYDDGADGDVC
ncbi:MAG: hypothetical protein ACNYPI_01385 [Arenicellales bacterium WSBS_2016_MAG_OTU3]